VDSKFPPSELFVVRLTSAFGATYSGRTVPRLNQANPRVFGQSYVANCSLVDSQAALRQEEGEQRHIVYSQSLERFHGDRLPDKLPSHIEEELRRVLQLRELQDEVQSLIR
jgi:hypothetical protein